MDEGKPLGVGPVVVIANALRDLEGDEDPPQLLLRELLAGAYTRPLISST